MLNMSLFSESVVQRADPQPCLIQWSLLLCKNQVINGLKVPVISTGVRPPTDLVERSLLFNIF
jgi:hypothetical protein